MSDRLDDASRPPVDERLERQIVRQLDGELDAAGRTALTRKLLRDPEAHRLRDDYAAVDRAGGEALREAFARERGEDLRRCLPPAPGRRAARWARVAAVAAAGVVLAIGAGAAWHLRKGPADPGNGAVAARSPRGNPATVPVDGAGGGLPSTGELPPGIEGLLWRVWESPTESWPDGDEPQSLPTVDPAGDVPVPLPRIQGPRRTRRDVDRHIFGVYDKDRQTVYLLGVDRVRTRVHAIGKDL